MSVAMMNDFSNIVETGANVPRSGYVERKQILLLWWIFVMFRLIEKAVK